MTQEATTKSMIARSLKDLMKTRSFRKITISDITAGCGLNRKSFYYHFRDKYDLLNWMFLTGYESYCAGHPVKTGIGHLQRLADFFETDRPFWRKAIRIQGQNSLTDSLRAFIRPMAHCFIQPVFGDTLTEFDVDYFSEGLIRALVRWLAEKPEQSSEALTRSLLQYFRQTSPVIYENFIKVQPAGTFTTFLPNHP